MRKSLLETPLLKTRILPIALLLLLCGGPGLHAQDARPPEGGTTNSRDRQIAVRPAPTPPPAQLPRADENWIVAVGINRFKDEKVNPLSFCAADAKAVYKFFLDAGFAPADRAYLLTTDAPAESKDYPTRINILKAVQYAAEHATDQSTILLFFGSHGFVDSKGESYILPQDGDSGLLSDSGVAVARINEMLRGSKSKRKVVFVDACRNTPFKDAKGQAVEGRAAVKSEVFLEALKSASGQVTLAACGPGQASFEDSASGHGVYTAHLLKGLGGAARADERGLIDVSSLQKYLAEAVPAWSRQMRRDVQNPWMWGEMSVPIPLAMAKSGAGIPPLTPTPVGPSDLEKELAAVREKEKMKEKAQESYGTLAGVEKETATTRAEADKRLRLWKLYVQEYGSAEYQIAEAEQKVSFYEKWTAPAQPSTPSMPSTPGGEKKSMTADLGGGVKMELVWVPAGSFQMGSPSSESGHSDDEGPVHSVELDGFWMGKYEVTQEQYEAVMEKNPSNFKGAKNPVEMVSWNDATDFCRKLTDKVGRASSPAKSFRLPTEAEWEYACRAGSTTRFCFGDSDSNLGDYAWYTANSGSKTHPVGEKKANEWGLYDMHGNVWEWCGDWYADKYGAGSAKNPQGASSGECRVLRGGSWNGDPHRCRSADRGRSDPTGTNNGSGFRVVCGGFSSR